MVLPTLPRTCPHMKFTGDFKDTDATQGCAGPGLPSDHCTNITIGFLQKIEDTVAVYTGTTRQIHRCACVWVCVGVGGHMCVCVCMCECVWLWLCVLCTCKHRQTFIFIFADVANLHMDVFDVALIDC